MSGLYSVSRIIVERENLSTRLSRLFINRWNSIGLSLVFRVAMSFFLEGTQSQNINEKE
jgi:hypothetical protein